MWIIHLHISQNYLCFTKKPKGTPIGLMTVTSDAGKYEGAMNHFFETEPIHSFRRVSSLQFISLADESQSDSEKSKIDQQKTSGNLKCSSTFNLEQRYGW